MRGFLLMLVLCPVNALSQYPSLTHYKLSEITTTRFEYKGCFLNGDCYEKQKKRVTEVPPWVIQGGWRTYFFVDGRQSVLWTTPKPLTTSSRIDLKNDALGPYIATRPYIMERLFSALVPKFDWRRNYHAIFSAHVIDHATAGTVTLGFCHSENKNEVSGDCESGTRHQNTIQANMPIDCNDPQSWSGGRPYRDGWNAYNGILNAVWTPYTAEANWGEQYFPHDLGPIAWPATGYVTPEGAKCTSGLRHPSSLLRGDSVYIFFIDAGPFADNIPKEEGRLEGVKVLRVHKDQALDVNNYTIYFKDSSGGARWHRSLPEGFTKEKMLQYVAVKGPKSTDILNDTDARSQMIRFSVARLKNTNSYVGVEQYIDLADLSAEGKPKFKVALRLSTDLVNWSGRQLILYSANSWEESQLNYPVFLNKEGTSNTEVDANEFYVVGSEHTPRDHVNKIRVYDPDFRPPPEPQGAMMALVSSPAGLSAEAVEVLLFPNPFVGLLTIRMQVPSQSQVRLALISAEGRRLRTLAHTTGIQRFTASFDLSFCAPGLYLLECMVDELFLYRKIVKQ